jgi:hypothetical protein
MRAKAAMTDQGSPRRRRPRPLAVAATSLASFLAVLTLLGAQLHAGHDPALGGTPVAVVSGHGGKQIVTRTSGGTVTTSSAGKHTTTHHPITTRTSGRGDGEGGEHDD